MVSYFMLVLNQTSEATDKFLIVLVRASSIIVTFHTKMQIE